MSDKFHFVEVLEKTVNPERVRLAGLMADFCAKKFNFRRPRIRWFEKATELDYRYFKAMSNLEEMAGHQVSRLPLFGEFDESARGFFLPSEDFADSIFLRDDLDWHGLKSTFCHELWHFLKGVRVGQTWGKEEQERAAEKFQQELLFELGQRVLFA